MTHFILLVIWPIFRLCTGFAYAQIPTHLSIAIESEATAEIPIRFTVTLTDSAHIPLPNQTLLFQDLEAGSWNGFLNGSSDLNTITGASGGSEILYLPGRTSSITVHVAFPATGAYLGSDTTIVLSVEPRAPSFQDTPDLLHTKGDGIPLILVHGRSGPGLFTRWNTFLDHVRESPSQFAEFDIHIWDHDTRKPIGFDGRSGNAQDLYDSLTELSASYSDFTPVFIAHSRGGLVVRSLMGRTQPDGTRYGDHVLGLVTLGTPHHGSPLAVADWAGAIWREAWGDVPGGELFFRLLVGSEGLLFETDLVGDANLAWDNYDLAVRDSGYRSRQTVFDRTDQVDVSPADLNVDATADNDVSIVYHDVYKKRFGTLAGLNTPGEDGIAFRDRIVTIGAHRKEPSSLLQNLISAVQIVLSLPGSSDAREWLEVHLDEGDRDHNLLSLGNRLLAHTVSDLFEGATIINYDANDGLVPLQSALLLAPTGNITEPSLMRRVSLDRDRISSARQVRAHHIFSTNDGIEDHLDLLVTDNAAYWNIITQETRQFLSSATNLQCAPDLDGSKTVDFSDFLIFAEMFSSQDLRADFNVDGATDFNDFLIFAVRFGQTCL